MLILFENREQYKENSLNVLPHQRHFLFFVSSELSASDMFQCRDRGKNRLMLKNTVWNMPQVNRYPRKAWLLRKGAPLCETHDYTKVITTWPQEHSVAALSHNSIGVI